MEHDKILAALRPGMPESALPEAQRPASSIVKNIHDPTGERLRRRRYSLNPGEVTVDAQGVIDQVHYAPSFPESYTIEGLHIGMDWAKAKSLLPELQIRQDGPHVQTYYGVTAPEGFELWVTVLFGKISSFTLYRAGFAQYVADISAPKEPKPTELSDILAALRPGMPESAFPEAQRPAPQILTIFYDPDGEWPPRRRYRLNPGNVTVDAHGVIDEVFYSCNFPKTYNIEGLHIGMDWAEAKSLFPDLQVTVDGLKSKIYSGATTPKGFELQLHVVDDKLFSFTLWRAGFAQYMAELSAFTKPRQEAAEAAHKARVWDNQNPSRIIADPTAMLREWAGNSTPAPAWVAYAEWLIKATPDQRHVAATGWNWDFGVTPLLYVIMQPDCDLATALAVFHLNEPDYFRRFDENPNCQDWMDEEAYDLTKEIRLRVNAGFYTRKEIAFDGVREYDRRIPDAPFVDRAAFRVNLIGRTPPPIACNGYGMPLEALKDLPEAERI